MARPDAPTPEDIAAALAGYPGIRATKVSPLAGGLINHSYRVRTEGGDDHVLQRLHPVFEPAVNHNVRAVTEHLWQKGLVTPRIVLAGDGRPWTEPRAGEVWRLATWVEGATFAAVGTPAQARAAAALLARFHGALADLEHEFLALRVGVHDTPAHLRRLREAVTGQAGHRLHADVSRLCDEILGCAGDLPPIGDVPDRVVHGDPKFSNVVFAGSEGPARERAVCLIDLDTVGPMALHLELGDAWRSWCNPHGEDVTAAGFDMEIFRASVEGYASASTLPLGANERVALVHGVEWITLELAARFAADALLESYFGWDPASFAGAGEHNLVRARGQLSLHRATLDTRAERAEILRRALDSGSLTSC